MKFTLKKYENEMDAVCAAAARKDSLIAIFGLKDVLTRATMMKTALRFVIGVITGRTPSLKTASRDGNMRKAATIRYL